MFGTANAHVVNHAFRRAIFALCVLILGCQPTTNSLPKERSQLRNTSLVVNVTTAEFVEDVTRRHINFGVIRPEKASTLGFARGGQVDSLSVAVGNPVKKGDTIAQLEQQALQRQRQQLVTALESTRKSLENLQNNANQPNLQSQTGQTRQRAARLESQLRDLDLELSKGIVRAPYDGIVSEQYVHIGDSIAAGRPVVRIVGSDNPTIELNLPLKVAKQLPIGHEVKIGSTDLSAMVSTKSAELDAASRTQRVTCNLNANSNIDWAYGESVEVHIDLPANQSGIWLPFSALQKNSSGLWSVFVVVDSDQIQVVEQRTLAIQMFDEQRVLVQGSIANGDQIVVDGLHRIVAGQRVSIERDSSLDDAETNRQPNVPDNDANDNAVQNSSSQNRAGASS